jgi:ATP-dependent Lon protease
MLMPKRKDTSRDNLRDASRDLDAQYQKYTFGEETSEQDLQYLRKKSKAEQEIFIQKLTELYTLSSKSTPLMFRLLESAIPDRFKFIAYKKILDLANDHSGKLYPWIDAFLRIPQTIVPLPVDYSQPYACHVFLKECELALDRCTYGMRSAKDQFLQLIGKWLVNPGSMGTAIALKGPMGTGKTTLIKHGISKLLNRPFAFVPLGGASDGCFLEGHSFTYEGSTYGKIVDILIQSKVSNPVIFFDELDKISEKGNDITGILTHLIDTTQNTQFHDKYFSELDFDMSKCLFVFSYNDESLVNPILRDRMTTIEIPGYERAEKIIIARDYLVPELEKEYNLPMEWNDALLDLVLEKTEPEAGVRNLKRSLDTLYSKLNLRRILHPSITFSLQVTEEEINALSVVNEPAYSSMYL